MCVLSLGFCPTFALHYLKKNLPDGFIEASKSTNVLAMMNPQRNAKQMMIELAMLRTLGGRISAVTTQIRVPYPALPKNLKKMLIKLFCYFCYYLKVMFTNFHIAPLCLSFYICVSPCILMYLALLLFLSF